MDAAEIIKSFPKLSNDSLFKVTSKPDIKYNCIGWALIYDSRWVWPPSSFIDLDGVYHYWPVGIKDDDSLDAFIEMFGSYGYQICDNADHEPEFRKVAIYVNPSTGKCTHAARQNRAGIWLSKLGRNHDITHQDPTSLEGSIYGVVGVIMKKSLF